MERKFCPCVHADEGVGDPIKGTHATDLVFDQHLTHANLGLTEPSSNNARLSWDFA